MSRSNTHAHDTIILGIDPGIATTGYGVIEISSDYSYRCVDYGVVTTPSKTPLTKRLWELYLNMERLIQQFRPDEIGVEELFFTKNVKTAIAVSHARGVILLACSQSGCPVFEYTPLQVKQAITGYGGAPKQQVQAMVTALLDLGKTPTPDDAADAVAVAICLANHRKMEHVIFPTQG